MGSGVGSGDWEWDFEGAQLEGAHAHICQRLMCLGGLEGARTQIC